MYPAIMIVTPGPAQVSKYKWKKKKRWKNLCILWTYFSWDKKASAKFNQMEEESYIWPLCKLIG